MGLTETLVDHVSIKSALLLGPSLLLAYMIVAVIVRPAFQEIKLARMPGARAQRVNSVLPFGEQDPPRLVCHLSRGTLWPGG
jgi:hypothetical protein